MTVKEIADKISEFQSVHAEDENNEYAVAASDFLNNLHGEIVNC